MIRDGNKLAIRVEVPGWVEALNLKGFEYVSLIGKFDERMMIYKKCTRIESQREKNQTGNMELIGKKRSSTHYNMK